MAALRIAVVFGALVLGFPTSVATKEKKYQPPPQTYPKSRLINRSCQAVWSAAMPIMTQTGFTPQTMERESGIASFTFNRSSGEFTSTDDVKKLTTAPAGFWNRYTAFGIQSASLTVSPEVGACTCQIAINYAGFVNAVMRGSGWVALESNGLAEKNLLDKIQERAQKASFPYRPRLSQGCQLLCKQPPRCNRLRRRLLYNQHNRLPQPLLHQLHQYQTCKDCPEKVFEVPFSSSRPDRRHLKCDEAITIVSESQNWIRVKTTDGIEGYISPKFLGK